ncbi:MAG TPA: hypothetical protein VHV78_07320 [Gemmatimonadaceae bacterium]|jgi:hypothetical protein|nr:hypothetical protein [Gemmatimonadaceae bacterium]
MSQSIERDVRFLKRYAVATTTLLVVLSLAAFTRPYGGKAKFDEIDVERINIVEPNGHYRMVLSNRPRSIGPVYKGQPFGYAGGGRPGIIFFNDEGTENGGLTFTGSTCVNGRSPTTGRQCRDGSFNASTHMSFDQFNSDQVVNFDYNDNNGQRLMGFSINDRADFDIKRMVDERDSINKIADTVARNAALVKLFAPRNGIPLNAQRLFLGRDPNKAAVLNLSDRTGQPRLRIAVDSLGAPHIDFLDEAGHVTYSLPDARK